MAKFLPVKVAPTTLKKGEHVIAAPNFLTEILANQTKAPRGNLTGRQQLRYIADEVARRYAPEELSGFSVKVHMFEGRPYKDNNELNEIVVEMFATCAPVIFKRYLEYQIKNRPTGTTLIYCVESPYVNELEVFQQQGIERYEQEKPKRAPNKGAFGKITNNDSSSVEEQ